MTRIACLMMREAEEQILRPWLLYHGYLFGFENLYVRDNGSVSESRSMILREFATLGVNLASDGNSAGAAPIDEQIIRQRLDGFLTSDPYDLILPLDGCDFLAVNGSDGVSCERTVILRELERIQQSGVSSRIQSCLSNCPGHIDLFEYSQCQKNVVVTSQIRGDDTDENEYARTLLWCIRLTGTPADPLQQAAQSTDSNSRERFSNDRPLVRYRGLKRFLAVMDFTALRLVGTAQRPSELPSGLLELDLDRSPFRTRDYQLANPDLSGADFDLFEHFLSAGYWEGRRLEASRSGLAEVAVRMAVMRNRRRDGFTGYAGLSRCLASLERADECEDILRLAIEEFGETAPILLEQALLATYRQAWELAVRRWDRFRFLYPESLDGYDFGALACHQAGLPAEEEAVVLAGLERFPGDVRMTLRYIDIATARRDWRRVKMLWDEVVTTHPDRQEVKDKAGPMTFLLRTWQTDQLEHPAMGAMDGPVVVEMSERETQETLQFLGCKDAQQMRQFFLQFESLGYSCEFGIVQRRYGAEPISLLRWNSIQTSKLMVALDNDFVGIDDPDNLEFQTVGGEYVLTDRIYATAMHTFIYEAEVAAAELLAKQTKRMKFLRRKLISDLQANEKLFVHLEDASLSRDEIERLRRSFRRYGNGCLLYVRVAAVPSKVGRIELGGEGLLLGYIERPGRGPDGNWSIDFASWLKLCRDAHSKWQMMAPRTATRLAL